MNRRLRQVFHPSSEALKRNSLLSCNLWIFFIEVEYFYESEEFCLWEWFSWINSEQDNFLKTRFCSVNYVTENMNILQTINTRTTLAERFDVADEGKLFGAKQFICVEKGLKCVFVRQPRKSFCQKDFSSSFTPRTTLTTHFHISFCQQSPSKANY